jgi:hypothetical protein
VVTCEVVTCGIPMSGIVEMEKLPSQIRPIRCISKPTTIIELNTGISSRVAFPVSSLISAFLLPQPLASLGPPRGRCIAVRRCRCLASGDRGGR